MTLEVFSSYEQQVLKILGSKKMSIEEIAQNFSWDSSQQPAYPSNSVAGYVRQINRKCEYHKFKWFINSYGAGRAGKTIWKDKLK